MSDLAHQRTAAPAHATGAVEFVALADVSDDVTFRLRPEGDVSDLATSLGRLGQLVPVELRALPGAGDGAPRWQVVAGFRRLAAVRLLARDRVLARLHHALPDEDAWALAVAQALLTEPPTAAELDAVRERLAARGVAAWAEELFDDAKVRAPLEPELRERFHRFLNEPLTPALSPQSGERESEPVGAGLGPPAAVADAGGPTAAPKAGADEARAPATDDRGQEIVELTPDELAADLATRLAALNQDLATAFEAWEDLPAEGRRAILEQARWVAGLLAFLEAE